MALRHELLRFLGIGPGHPYVIRLQEWRRTVLQTDGCLRDAYLSKEAKPKLQIGGGWHRLEGWLNTDIELIPEVMRMDATRPFPFEDATFEYIFTEHMIEHVTFQQGAFMLRECHRVLRQGGVIRVVTPNLTTILGLYGTDLSSQQQEYLAWFCQTFVPEPCPRNAASTINAMFRMWGHQFIYDESVLMVALSAAGFSAIRRWSLGASGCPDLQNLENEQRYPKGLLDFESLVLEARKDGSALTPVPS
jgi:predicted SAM-dependent methyltransferase